MCMGLPEEREEEDQRGDGKADAQAVGESLSWIARVAAKGARKAEKVIHRRPLPSRHADGRGRVR
ncbi:hypothetical protein GCM10010991_34940 [Gemmobacter aquaticus]|uniref:Uncharacterized protein n=1 Tax=Gemmobacter aquaticus TaxID=490185 RepID=A0A918DDW7_9RHOB|nr:hypothetical protein GCM10010991_34940 [Gemmobacter aquaticus]